MFEVQLGGEGGVKVHASSLNASSFSKAASFSILPSYHKFDMTTLASNGPPKVQLSFRTLAVSEKDDLIWEQKPKKDFGEASHTIVNIGIGIGMGMVQFVLCFLTFIGL